MSDFFVHPQGICESRNIGEGTRIWAFTHVLPQAKIGRNCTICDHVFIENDVVLGDRVTVKCGVQLWDGSRVGDDVAIGANVTFAAEAFSESQQQPPPATTIVGNSVSIGAGTTILSGVRIGLEAMVGPGSVVTLDVPPRAIVAGNPARLQGYIDAHRCEASCYRRDAEIAGDGRQLATSVPDVTIHVLKSVADLRGNLSVGQFGDDIPFRAQRYFIVFDVPVTNGRGEHAHRRCKQFLVCVKGTVAVIVDDGRLREEIVLDRPNLGLYIPPMVWAVQYQYSSDAVLLVFASEPYEAADYIRDYDEFLRLTAAQQRTESPVLQLRRAA
jgi:acetyltransferase-like isoleucine patch superfamily enzyme/dTDP-4-dehydrorhamnose 3,5-epimerase-like enzyme